MKQRARVKHLVIAVLLAAVASIATMAAAAGPIVIKVNNDVAADALKGQTWRVFKQSAEKYLGNKVDIQIFDGGSLYNQTNQITALQQGNIQFIAPGTGVYGGILPSFAVFELPYLFKSPQMIDAAIKSSDIGGILLGQMKSKNLRAAGVWLNGWRMVGANKPIQSLADLKGLKIRVPPGKNYVATFQALGANVTPIAWGEVPQALQQHIIDAVEPTANNWYADKLYQLAPDITYSDHIYSFYLVGTNATWWNSLPPDIQNGLQKALNDAQQWNWDHVQAANQDAINKMKAAGTKFYSLSQTELDKWQQIIQQQVWPEFANQVGPDLLNRIIALGKNYKWAGPQ